MIKVRGVTHGSAEDEERAVAWHDFGIAVSWAMAGACGACCFVAVVGAFWHAWGKRQHARKLQELTKKTDESGMFV